MNYMEGGKLEEGGFCGAVGEARNGCMAAAHDNDVDMIMS